MIFDREYVNDMAGEGKRECGECGVWWFEDQMTPFQDRHGTWWRCPSCAERDARAYAEQVA